MAALSHNNVRAFGFLLEGSQRLLAAVEADMKADSGMSLSELEVLIHLAQESESGVRPRDLADRCVMSTSGCTRLLDRLEQQRLVERRALGSDRRGLMVFLTVRGPTGSNRSSPTTTPVFAPTCGLRSANASSSSWGSPGARSATPTCDLTALPRPNPLWAPTVERALVS